jgi:hypothetical protein
LGQRLASRAFSTRCSTPGPFMFCMRHTSTAQSHPMT